MIIRPSSYTVTPLTTAERERMLFYLDVIREEYERLVGDLQYKTIREFHSPKTWDTASLALGGVRASGVLGPRTSGVVDLVWADSLKSGGAGAWGTGVIDRGNLTRGGTTDYSKRIRAWLPWHEFLHSRDLDHALPLRDWELSQRTDMAYMGYERFAREGAALQPFELELLRSNHVSTAVDPSVLTLNDLGNIYKRARGGAPSSPTNITYIKPSSSLYIPNMRSWIVRIRE